MGITDRLLMLVENYGYAVLFPLSTIEGPFVTVVAGFLVSTGVFSFFPVFLITLAGDLIGDSIYYFIGFFGREKFIKKWGSYIKVTSSSVKRLEDYFYENVGKTLVFGKVSYGISAPLLISSGLAKVRYTTFFKYSLIASAPKVLVLIGIGFYFKEAYEEIFDKIRYTSLALTLLIILAVLIYLGVIKMSKYFQQKI